MSSIEHGHARHAATDAAPARLTSGRVWRELAGVSFAVLGFVTPAGEPRSSGVVYAVAGRSLFVAVGRDSWKARYIATAPKVSVTVPVRRGGPLALVAPIPPATITFQADASVYAAGAHPLPERLASLIPPESRDTSSIIELRPYGTFLTYGIGVPLLRMRHPAEASARTPVD